MQTQIAWPLIEALGASNINITVKGGTIVTFLAGSVGEVLLKYNPQRPTKGVENGGTIGFGFYVEEVVKDRIERVFKIDDKIIDVADYRTEGITVVLYSDGRIKEIDTFVKGLPKTRQKAMQAISSSKDSVVVNVDVVKVKELMTEHGCEFRLLEHNGVSHHVVITPKVSEKMIANIMRSNDIAALKANSALWKILNS